MNENLQQSLAEIISKASAGIDTSTAFLSAQIPDVIQQLLLYKLADASCAMVISVASLFACQKLFKYCLKKSKEESQKPYLQQAEGMIIASGIASFLTFVIGMAGTLDSLSTILKISLAPKIYLIEYAASLTK